MKTLHTIARQSLVDQILRTGHKINVPEPLQPQIQQVISKRLDTKKKITKSDIKKKKKYISYTKDLQAYPQRFFDPNFYGFPLELLKGFNNFIDYAYEQQIIPKFIRSKQQFRTFEFNNDNDYYEFISTLVGMHFYIVLLKYKSKIFLMLYDTYDHYLHFALPISEDY